MTELTSSLTRHKTSRIFNKKIADYYSETISHKLSILYREKALKSILLQTQEDNKIPGESGVSGMVIGAIAAGAALAS